MGEMSAAHPPGGGAIAVGSYQLRPSSQPGDDRWYLVDGDDHAIGYLDTADGAMHLYDERDRRAFELAVLAALPAVPPVRPPAPVSGAPRPRRR
jgi:hypothetical protein